MNNTLAIMIERVDSVQEKIDNVSREMKTQRQNKNMLEIKKDRKEYSHKWYNISVNDGGSIRL